MKELTTKEAKRVQVLIGNSTWESYTGGIFFVFSDKNTFYIHCYKRVDSVLVKVKVDTWPKNDYRLQIFYE